MAGFSLGGFELDDPTSDADAETTPSGSQRHTDRAGLDVSDKAVLRGLAYPATFTEKGVYGLRDQIALCYARVEALVRYTYEAYGWGGSEHGEREGGEPVGSQETRKVNVVLMGHSVGAYIALEIVRMHYQRRCSSGIKAKHETSSEGGSAESDVQFDIVSAVLLTPTIINIAHSSSGKIATPLLSYFPFFPWVVQLASSGLTNLVSRQKLNWLVRRVTGMKDESSALEATVGFLRKNGCVRQALYLAGDEMSEIGKGQWGREVWGVLKPEYEDKNECWKAPKLYFWFARTDHWVANVTREEIVRISRESSADDKTVAASSHGRPDILIDQDEGLVHAWCIEQSVMVARRVRIWLEQSLEPKR